jgi:hypothetical protein
MKPLRRASRLVMVLFFSLPFANSANAQAIADTVARYSKSPCSLLP